MRSVAWAACPLGLLLLVSSGCMFVPVTQLNECQAQNRSLSSQSHAQVTEIQNLRAKNVELNQRLAQAEEQLAKGDEQLSLMKAQLVNFEAARGEFEELKTLRPGRLPMPPAVSKQLAELSRRYPSLHFDPKTGIAKVDTDVLFDTGQTEIREDAEAMLRDLVRVLKTPAASDLKVMVVGHTDDRQMARRPARDQYPNNFHLSAGRALAVADRMKQAGMPEERMGVAGFAAHEPIAAGRTADERRKNRRVEIFVMTPDVPVVGWVDSMPSMY